MALEENVTDLLIATGPFGGTIPFAVEQTTKTTKAKDGLPG